MPNMINLFNFDVVLSMNVSVCFIYAYCYDEGINWIKKKKEKKDKTTDL